MKRRRKCIFPWLVVFLLALSASLSLGLMAPKRRRFAFLADRYIDEMLTLSQELALKKHHTVWVSNSTVFDYKTSGKWDLIILDRRMIFPKQLVHAENIVIFDTDLLLDIDTPSLSVPAPLSPYGTLEEEYKESTLRRVANGINRLKFHLSAFSQARKLPKTYLTISTSSLLFESSRMFPPWLHLVGRISKLRRPSTEVPAIDPDIQVLVGVFGRDVSLSLIRQAMERLRLSAETSRRVKLLAIIPSVVDISEMAAAKDIIWCVDCDTTHVYRECVYNDVQLSTEGVLTTGEVSIVTELISLEMIPMVIADRSSDVHAKEMGAVLKRRNLGLNLLEESLHSIDELNVHLEDCCSEAILRARDALSAPLESTGRTRAVEILESLAENPAHLTKSLILEVPTWYQYWFLDVYLVYGLVMVSVFVLAGSITSGASSLLLHHN